MNDRTPPVLVQLTRGGIVESQHRGYACVVGANGDLLASWGNPDFPTFLRSSAKPLQAIAAVTSGAVDHYGITERELAIIAGSHGGEPIHVAAVRSILLARIGLSESALQCGVQQPLDAAAREELARAGASPASVHHNCSGKHSGMLAAGCHEGQTISDYLNVKHPVQDRIIQVIAAFAGIKPESIVIGVDGCSAPVHAVPMKAAALAFARLVDPIGLPDNLAKAASRVVAAMRRNPVMVAATRERICTQLIIAGKDCGLIGKAGAEGYYAAAWNDPSTGRGIGLTVKMEDGMQRGRDPVLIAILQKYGALPSILPESLKPFASAPIRNFRDLIVGEMKCII